MKKKQKNKHIGLKSLLKKTAAVSAAVFITVQCAFSASAFFVKDKADSSASDKTASSASTVQSSPEVHSIPISSSRQFRNPENTKKIQKMSLTEYSQVDPEEAASKQTLKPGEIAASDLAAAAGTVIPVNLAYNVKAGQFGFTTYGWGHGVGMSQNGANAYATYSGYNYQQILFHYYPGTTLVQTTIPESVTAGGKTGSVLDIVSMVVFNEMSSTMHPEAMKAQAVAAYSIIMHPDGACGGLICKPNPPENVREAVRSVLGQALYYNGSVALAVFSASSGGYSASSYDVFRTNYPYLVSVPCELDAQYDPHFGSVTYKSTEEVRQALQNKYGVSLSSDNPVSWIQLTYGPGGYVTSAVVGGRTVTGESLRAALGLKSGRFTFVVA